MQKFDVIIVGGGVVGLTLAALLAQEELSIALIDRDLDAQKTDASVYDIRVSAINLASVAIFKSLGIWQSMQDMRVSPYRHMRVWDAKSPAHIEFDSSEVSQPYLGYVVEQRVMRQVLWKQLQTQKHVRLYSATPKALHEKAEQIEIQLDNQTRIAAPLLVGADGKNSWVAKHAFVDSAEEATSTSMGIVATLRTERPHEQTALQRFLPTGPVALLPLADPNLVSLVWSTTREEAEILNALSAEEFNLKLEQATEYALGKLTLCDQRAVFPLQSYRAPHYVKPRVALVGDAAHTILPLAGQGLNLGLLDAASLAQVIVETQKKQRDIGALLALRRYERWRKTQNTTMLLAMEGFNKLFTNSFEGARLIRHMGFALTQKLPWVKKYFMRQAIGLGRDLPEKAMVESVMMNNT